MAQPRTAITWLTHFDDAKADEAFARLAREASGFGTVVEVRQHSTAPHRPSTNKPNALVLSDEDLARLSPHRFRQMKENSAGVVGGYVDLVHISAALSLGGFDFYWFIEYDVDFSGDWSTFFRAFESSTADVLTTNVRPRSAAEAWMHWRWTTHPDDVDPQKLTRSFMPIGRLSRRLVELYAHEAGSWAGHYEALYPTMALHFGLSVEDIGAAGPFTPSHRRGRFYYTGASSALDVGSLRAFPPVGTTYYPQSGERLPLDHLWHPIKSQAYEDQRKERTPETENRRPPGLWADGQTRYATGVSSPASGAGDLRLADLNADLLRAAGGVNAEWYLAQYPDISEAGVDPVEHYWMHGWREGRDPGPHFSTNWYLLAYPDVADADVNPLAHFLAIGRDAGYGAGSLELLREAGGLDADWYLARYPDLSREAVDPHAHYWEHGWHEGRDPGPHFSTTWYLRAYPQVAEKGINPLVHYLSVGRHSGWKPARFQDFQSQLAQRGTSPWYWLFSEEVFFPRKHTPPPPADGAFGNPKRRPILFAGHAASRTGAPLILLRLMEHFAALPDVELFLFLETDGPLLDDFQRLAHVLVNKDNLFNAPGQKVIPTLLDALVWRGPMPALCNSAASWQIQEAFREAGLSPIVSLIHDNLLNYEHHAVQQIYASAKEIVFSSDATRQGAASVLPSFADARLIPQGLLQASFGSGSRTAARQRVRLALGNAPDAPIVLACGSRDLRKGADLFADVARRVFATSAADVHFLWLGDPLPEAAGNHLEWSARIPADLRDRLHWHASVVDPEEHFLAADIFLLTSRDDPFPCVVHEAMAAGLKIIVFEGSGGAPEAIAEDCGISVPHLDTGAMAEAVGELLAHPLRSARLGERAARRVRTRYVFSDYAAAIIDLVTREDAKARRARQAPKVFFSQRDWGIGGVNTLTGDIVRELNQRGIDARLLFVELPETHRRFVPDVPQEFLNAGGEPLPGRWHSIERFLTVNAPCILVPGYDYVTSALSPRLPSSVGIIGTLHANDTEHFGHARRVGRFWNRMLAVSEEIAANACNLLGDLGPENIRYVPNFVSRFDAPKREIGSSAEPIRLIYTGRLVERPKRMSDLAMIANRLAQKGVPFRLSLVGTGPAANDLATELAPLVRSGSVTFFGRCDNEEVMALLRSSDLFLLTSELEGMSISLLEAMAQRCVPLVAASPSGISALVKDGQTGFLFDIGDVDGFSECIARLHAERKRVAEMSEAAYEHVSRNFSGAAVGAIYAAEIRDVWDEIASGSYVRPPSLIDGPYPGIAVPPALIEALRSHLPDSEGGKPIAP